MTPPQRAGQPVFTCFNSTLQAGEGRSEARAIFRVGAQASHCVLRHPQQPVHREFPCCSLQRSGDTSLSIKLRPSGQYSGEGRSLRDWSESKKMQLILMSALQLCLLKASTIISRVDSWLVSSVPKTIRFKIFIATAAARAYRILKFCYSKYKLSV